MGPASRHTCFLAIGTIVVTVFASPAPKSSAIPLGSGDTVALTGTNPTERPEVGGTLLAEAVRPFSISLGAGQPTLSGIVVDRAFRSDVTGTVLFEMQVSLLDDGGTAYGIVALQVGGFVFLAPPGFVSTDVDYLDDGPGTVAPTLASRTLGGPETVTFEFGSAVTAGDSSRFTINLTDAPNFSTCCGALVIRAWDGVGPLAETSVPVYGPIPEPASAALVGLGLTVLAARRRTRRVDQLGP